MNLAIATVAPLALFCDPVGPAPPSDPEGANLVPLGLPEPPATLPAQPNYDHPPQNTTENNHRKLKP